MSPTLHEYSSFDESVVALADLIAEKLNAGIAKNGFATLALSGGSTPKALFEYLAQMQLDWTNVRITLVDDRCVPPDHEASNARLVRESLLTNYASAAEFHTLHRPPLEGEPLVNDATDVLRTLFSNYDLVLLGMGEDGHTASIFPGSAICEKALDPNDSSVVMLSEKEEAGYFRITQTLSQLLQSDQIALQVKGPEKLQLLQQILEQGESSPYPIARFLFQQQVPVDIFAAEN